MLLESADLGEDQIQGDEMGENTLPAFPLPVCSQNVSACAFADCCELQLRDVLGVPVVCCTLSLPVYGVYLLSLLLLTPGGGLRRSLVSSVLVLEGYVSVV